MRTRPGELPFSRRLEYAAVGVVLGSAILLLTGAWDHSADTRSAGVAGLGTAVVCFIVLRVAAWSRTRRDRQ